MPYALIPDGYSLKKVTKLQKQALTDKRRHDNVMALLNNENTPLVVGGAVATFFGVQLAKNIILKLEETAGELAEDTKQAIREATQVTVALPTITTPSGLPFQPPDLNVGEFIEFATKKFGLSDNE